MSQAALLPLSLMALGFVLFGVSYAFKQPWVKRAVQVVAAIAEVAAFVIAIANIGAIIRA